MKLSLSTGSLYVYPLLSIYQLARDAGFDGVELVVSPEVLLRGGAAVGCLARDFDLTIFSLHPPLFSMPGWRDYETALRKIILLGQESGVSLIVVHPPNVPDWDRPHGRAFLRALDSVQYMLAESQIRLALENPSLISRGHRVMTDPETLTDFADTHNMSLVLDTAHAGTTLRPLVQTYQCYDGRLANVHFSDMIDSFPLPEILGLHPLFMRHQFPGEGRLPLADLLGCLVTDGYEGPVTLELSPVSLRFWWPPLVRRRLRQAVVWVQKALKRSQVN